MHTIVCRDSIPVIYAVFVKWVTPPAKWEQNAVQAGHQERFLQITDELRSVAHTMSCSAMVECTRNFGQIRRSIIRIRLEDCMHKITQSVFSTLLSVYFN